MTEAGEFCGAAEVDGAGADEAAAGAGEENRCCARVVGETRLGVGEAVGEVQDAGDGAVEGVADFDGEGFGEWRGLLCGDEWGGVLWADE